MATSSKIFVLTVLTLAAAASAGASMWISRRRRRSSDDSSAEPALPASSAATDAPQAPAAAAPASTAIIGPVPILAWRRQEGSIQILPFQSSSIPRFSSLHFPRLQFLYRTAAAPCRTNMIVGPVLTLAHVEQMAPPVLLSTFLTRPHQEMTRWCQKVCYFVFRSSVSLTGQMVYSCVIIEISFSITGVTVSVFKFMRGSGPTSLMSPSADETDAIALPPPAPVAGAPRAELAAGRSSDRQLAIASSPFLSRTSSPSLSPTSSGELSSHGFFYSASSDNFFSSDGSSSSLSRSTSGSSTDIEAANFSEAWLEFASPIPAPAILRIARSAPPSPTTEVDEAADEARKKNERLRRYIRRMQKKSRIWYLKVGKKLEKRLNSSGV